MTMFYNLKYLPLYYLFCNYIKFASEFFFSATIGLRLIPLIPRKYLDSAFALLVSWGTLGF